MDADFWEQMNPRFLTPGPEQSTKTTSDDPYPSVPSELKALRQWVMWKAEGRNGKPTKIPKQVTGINAKADTPVTWTDYSSVITAARTGKFDGIGFVFSPNDLYIGVDLDNCIRDRKLLDWAKEVLDRFQAVAYIEVSPSGNGIKIWTRAKLPSGAKHKVYINPNTDEAIEAYDTGRYFTVTGRGKFAIGNGQASVDWLTAKYLKQDIPSTSPARPPVKDTRDTSEIKRLIENSRQRAKFSALMQGNWEGQGYGSHSEADMGLISLLCFWTQDARQLDAIYRQSGLYRAKWDEKHRSDGATYGEMTIEASLSQSRETYTPRKKRKPKREGFYQARAKRRKYANKR